MRTLLLTLSVALVLGGCKGDPNTPEYWTKAITSSKSKKERARLVEELRSSKKVNESFYPMLRELLGSEKSPEVKRDLARLLGEQKDKGAIEALDNALDFGNPDSDGKTLNKEIAAALGNIGDPRAIPTLVKLLKVKDPYTQIEAINAVGALKAKEATGPLLEIAGNDNIEAFVTKKAVQALGEIAPVEAVPVLVQLMFKERKGVSFYMESSFALYQIGPAAADPLLPVLASEDKALIAWAEKNRVLEPALVAKAAQVIGDLHDMRGEKALLSKLGYENEMLDLKLFVRMRAADALGRMRSAAAVKPLIAMLKEEEANARQEYVRALVRIGSKEAVPALLKAAGEGSWDARDVALYGVSMLGDEKDIAALDKLAAAEPAATAAECKDNPDYAGCKDADALGKAHVAAIETYKLRLNAAKECKADASCWIKMLDDANAGVKERAGFDLGRSGKAEAVEPLLKHLREKNLDARVAIIQGIDWLVFDSKEAAAKAAPFLADVDKQLAEEKGKTDFIKVNEDLKRLSALLHRKTGA